MNNHKYIMIYDIYHVSCQHRADFREFLPDLYTNWQNRAPIPATFLIYVFIFVDFFH